MARAALRLSLIVLSASAHGTVTVTSSTDLSDVMSSARECDCRTMSWRRHAARHAPTGPSAQTGNNAPSVCRAASLTLGAGRVRLAGMASTAQMAARARSARAASSPRNLLPGARGAPRASPARSGGAASAAQERRATPIAPPAQPAPQAEPGWMVSRAPCAAVPRGPMQSAAHAVRRATG